MARLYKKIILSRTDGIGDVILTLPVAGVIKENFPGCKIFFLGNAHSEAIINSTGNIDEFINWSELQKLQVRSQITLIQNLNADAIIHIFPRPAIAYIAAKAKIPLRIGTNRRLYNLLYCNKLINYSRRRSDLHESQLNLKLLSGINLKNDYELNDIPKYYGLNKTGDLNGKLKSLLRPDKVNLIIHPKSKGSAREWGLNNFSGLIHLLPDSKYRIFITGSTFERELLFDFIKEHQSRIIDMTGKLDLNELISFINMSDGLIAASTGPLHIASALGKFACGLYAPIRPIFPRRWKPVGSNAHYLVRDKQNCNECKKTKDCLCIRSIDPLDVFQKIENNFFKHK